METHILIIHHAAGRLNRIEANRIKAVVNGMKKGGEGKISVVAFNNRSELEKKGISCKAPADYRGEEDYTQLQRDAIAFTELLGKKQIAENTTLIKFLEYENSSLWWFVEDTFYALSKSIFNHVAVIEQILEKEKPEKILIINDKSELARLVSLIADKRGISIQFIPPGIYLRLLLMVKRHLLMKLRPYISFQWGEVKGFLGRAWIKPLIPHSPSKSIAQRKILVTSYGIEQEMIDPSTGKKMRGDVILSPILRELEKDKANQLLFLRNFPALRLPKGNYGEGIIVKQRKSYSTAKIHQIVTNQKTILEEKWKQLAGNESFRQSFTYQGINLWDIFEDRLKFKFFYEFPEVVKIIELSKRIVEVEKPDAVVVASENSRDNRGLIAACHIRSIPVVALQHGMLSASDTLFSRYRCQAYELQGSPTKLSIIPDRLCVYGEDTKSILTQLGFPTDRVVITGQPRYDILVKAGEIFDRKRFCATWGIDSTKPIVLIGSQPFRHVAGDREDYRKSFYRSVFQALSDEPWIQIVIKTHPVEEEEWHEELTKEMGVKAVVLRRDSDTNEALYACDVLITSYSTVAVEAMILGKPVITINLTGNPDLVPYAQKGAAIGVYKAEDIAPAVKDALENPEVRKGLEKGRQRYLENQLYKTDGQATRRVVNLVYKMIQEKEGQNL